MTTVPWCDTTHGTRSETYYERDMRSIAHKSRAVLEFQGEYVVKANAGSGWFAVFPKTLKNRISKSKKAGRAGPNLIVYRTKTGIPRDHYVIPYSVVRGLLVQSTVTRSTANGSERWNFTLKNDRLHVSHRAGAIDVSEFYGARLLAGEDGAPSFDVDIHIANESASEGRLRLVRHLERERNRRIVRLKKKSAASLRCEVCGFLFEEAYGSNAAGYCEVHHLLPLSELDDVTNTCIDDLAIVCANCHRVIHLRNPPYSLEEVTKMVNE